MSFSAGTLTQSGTDYTLTGNGAGIGGTSDQWTAGRVAITGDTTIIAKFAGISGTTITSAFAGLSFREIDDPGSKAVHLQLKPSGVTSLYRSIASSTCTTVSTAATPVVTTTCWLKINRTGNLFSFYYSTDSLSWTALGSQSLVLASSIFAEVFAGSGVATTITANIKQVCIQNLASPTYTFTGLTASTAYSLTAVARDLATSPNDSAASAALSITTNTASVPAYVLQSVGTEAHGTSATCGAPSGVVAGYLLVLKASCRNNADTFSTPSGWTKISPNVNVTYCDLYARIATGDAGDNPPTMSSSGSNQIITQIACFKGSVYTGGLGTIVHASVDKRGTNNDVLYSVLTVSLNNCLIIAWGDHNKTATSNGSVMNALTGFATLGTQTAITGNSMTTWWGYAQQTSATNLAAVTQTRTGTAENLQYTTLYIALKTT